MTVRDAERFKDKIEVSLDSRQVFFLFFGGAVIACLVFVLGVMVGKRLEGRERVAHKATTSAQVDPLAALDELGADEQAEGKGDDLAFAAALAADAKKASPAPVVAPAPAPPKVTAAPAPEAAAAPAKAKESAKDADKDKDKEPGKEAKETSDKPKEKKGKFTLQISSFQERADADALVAKLSGSGYKPYLIMSNVPDKGVFFRVRIGEFGSKSDAQDAKSEFEKKQHLLAYVTKM
jgi:cell division septation protein DedD